FTATPPCELTPLSLPDALPICDGTGVRGAPAAHVRAPARGGACACAPDARRAATGHSGLSPAVRLIDAREKGRNDPSQLGEHQRSEEHTSELQSRGHLVCRLLL